MTPPPIREQFQEVRKGDFGIFGDPVEHSLSPAMHNPALRDWWVSLGNVAEAAPLYRKFWVTPDELPAALMLAQECKMAGLNITVPHKVAAFRQIGKGDAFARKVGAINTIKLESSGLMGYNTDGFGFAKAIETDLEFAAKGKTAFVIGTGGTGSVIINELLDRGASQVFFWNRTSGRAFPGSNDKRVSEITSDVNPDLIVNATSVGLKDGDPLPMPGLVFKKGQYAFDVVYNRETEFVKAARQAGAKPVGGLGMLLYQGVKAFEIWTGSKAPVEKMKASLQKALAKKGKT